MSEADREKWDGRYAGDAYRMGVGPKRWLAAIADRLPRTGRALDLAAGEGQNAVFLAERGLDVTAVDVSPVGLEKAGRLAAEHGVAIRTEVIDLEARESPIPAGPWDLITCSHYKQRSLAPHIAAALAPGGLAALCVLGTPNLERHAVSARFLVEPGELPAWFEGLGVEVLLAEDTWNGDAAEHRFECRLLVRKLSGAA